MGDSNLHNHKRVPFLMAGRAGGAIKGGVHLKAPNGTPLANVMLSVLHALGLDDLERFGDSEAAYNIEHGQHDGSDRNQAEVLLRISRAPRTTASTSRSRNRRRAAGRRWCASRCATC